MNRPFAILGFTYLASLFFSVYFSSLSFIISAIFLILFVVSLFFKSLRNKKTIPIIFLTISIAFSVYKVFSNIEEQSTKKMVDHDATITGTIYENPVESYGKYYYTIKTDSICIDGIENVPQSIKIIVSKSTAFDCDIYDKVTGKIHFYNKDSDGIFSSKNYYFSRGIHNFAYFYEYEDYSTTEETSHPPYYYCIKCNQTLTSSLRELLPKRYYSIAVGFLLGNKYFIDEEVISNFKTISISHLLSVSGFHVSIIAQFFIIIFSFLKLSKRKIYLFSCIGIICFMAIVGFPSSVVRAGIMLIIAYIGKIFLKGGDSLNSLGFATLLLAIVNPFAGSDISLILSVSATLGIILFSNRLNDFILLKIENYKKLNKAIKYCISLACVTISASLATIPITVFYFKQFSFISIIANILLIIPSMLVLILSLVTSITNIFVFLRFISMPLGILNSIAIEYIIDCSKILSSISFASISTAPQFLLFWAASTLLIFSLDLILNNEIKFRKTPILLSFILLLIGSFSYQLFKTDVTTLATVDVGTGCSLVISKNGHAAVLSCGGDDYESNKLTTYLNNKNIKKLDYLVLSDLKEKTSCYSKDIIKKYDPYYVVLPDSNEVDSRLSRTIADKSNSCYFVENSNINFWGNVKLNIVNSDEQSFIYLTINDVKLLISPSGGNMSYIPKEYNSCDIFLEGVYPEELNSINSTYMVMSNNINLVNSKIKEVIKSSKIPLATAGDGTIEIDFLKNNDISFRRIKK